MNDSMILVNDLILGGTLLVLFVFAYIGIVTVLDWIMK